jgi:hypothetical protein
LQVILKGRRFGAGKRTQGRMLERINHFVSNSNMECCKKEKCLWNGRGVYDGTDRVSFNQSEKFLEKRIR